VNNPQRKYCNAMS